MIRNGPWCSTRSGGARARPRHARAGCDTDAGGRSARRAGRAVPHRAPGRAVRVAEPEGAGRARRRGGRRSGRGRARGAARGPADDLVTITLGRQEIVAVCPPGTELRTPGRLPVGRLADMPLIATPPGESTRDLLDRALVGRVGRTEHRGRDLGEREAIAPLVLERRGHVVPAAGDGRGLGAQGAVVARLVPALTRSVGLLYRAAAADARRRGRSSNWRGRPARSSGTVRVEAAEVHLVGTHRTGSFTCPHEGTRCIDVLPSRQGPPAHRRRSPPRPRRAPVLASPSATSCSARRSSRRSPRASSRRCSAWAASGARSASSGRRRASTRPRSATPAASRRTRRTRRCARAHRPHRGRARRVRPEGHVVRRDARRSSGRTTTRRRACARATTSARSTAPAIYTFDDAQRDAAEASPTMFQERSTAAGYGDDHDGDRAAPTFYYAEDYHQQYLAKNPSGYCGLGGTGVSCPIGVARKGRSRSPEGGRRRARRRRRA